jgi:lysozyme
MGMKMAINPKVVDLYHDDTLSVNLAAQHDFARVFSAGYRGVIHKATQGASMVDAMFRAREIAARASGLLWGWYHYFDASDPAAQATHFYQTIGAGTRGPGILVLDFEDADAGVLKGVRWLELVEQLSGQIPWLYIGADVRSQMGNQLKPAFARYPLWLPEWGPVAHVPQPWEKYTLWQFTGNGMGPEPHTVPGIAHDTCDISSFDGTDDELRTVWLGAGAATADPGGPPDPWEAKEEENHDSGVREGDDSIRVDSVPDVASDALPPDDGPADGDLK